MNRNPNAPLRLLSLDGGGVRGLSSLMVLDSLMESIAVEEKRLNRRAQDDTTPLKPCDYFDLIGGTSTGGIIAILLGRLRLDCKQCISIYSGLARKIFAKDNSIKVGGFKIPTGTSRFSGQVLEDAIKSSLVELGYSENELMWDDSLLEEVPLAEGQRDSSVWDDVQPDLSESPKQIKKPEPFPDVSKPLGYGTIAAAAIPKHPSPLSNVKRSDTWCLKKQKSVHIKAGHQGCRAFVVTSLKNALGLPRILSTYNPNDRQTRIWEALRATSAAPTFFPEMTFGTPPVQYLDGGVGFNNPCAEVVYTAKSLWEGRSIGCILSVGTGLQTITSVKPVASWLPFGLGTDISLAAALVSMATGTQYVDNQLERMYPAQSETRYYRFDVDQGLSSISLEEWMRESEMAALTQNFMLDPAQVRRSQELASLMTKLSNLPAVFETPAQKFLVGDSGSAILDESFKHEELDFRTGFPFGYTPTQADLATLDTLRSTSPHGRAGLAIDPATRTTRKIWPVATDLDGDGRKEESIVTTCVKADNVCLRCLRTGLPAGRYRVKFIVCVYDTEHNPPSEVVFSVGRPFDTRTFEKRHVDVRISTDVVPVLLHPDAARVRIGRRRAARIKGRGWVEIEADVPVEVGLEGALGLMVTKRFEEGVFVGGWSFGGVRLEPVFGEAS